MRNVSFKTKLSLLLILSLLVAAVAIGCGEKVIESPEFTGVTDVADAVGEGEYSFDFSAVFADGTKKSCVVSSDCETVGEALISLGLIEGEDGAYGLYVKSVLGVVADYNTDKTYWALYTDGEMSMVGIDTVKCKEVSSVELRVEK
ncbi:MAG: DUF4430 domain-containing protein [Clostridia bacterium]|nr:DUF4430 domain-containing protein [Clostridia bacterium]